MSQGSAADVPPMSWNELRRCRVTVPEHVVHRALAEETVLLNVRTSTYHTLDAVGARFFEVMRQAATVEAACGELAAEYEQPLERIQADMEAFCRDLVERELIELSVAPAAPAGHPGSV